MSLGIERTFEGEYDDLVARTETALKTEGFGILTRIDVKETLKAKLDVDFEKYVILGACNPTLAHKALSTSRDVGLLLPCNVVVYEKAPGTIVVTAMNPKLMSQIMPQIDLSEVVAPATEKLTAALDKI